MKISIFRGDLSDISAKTVTMMSRDGFIQQKASAIPGIVQSAYFGLDIN